MELPKFPITTKRPGSGRRRVPAPVAGGSLAGDRRPVRLRLGDGQVLPHRAAIERRMESRSREWQRIQKELFAKHGG